MVLCNYVLFVLVKNSVLSLPNFHLLKYSHLTPCGSFTVMLVDFFFNKYLCRGSRLLSEIHELSILHLSYYAHAIGTFNLVSWW